ncbi:hypothetical protein CTI12_AA301020 [Artemisia annua]|uniref:Uncharacterized protein n=1 Tax=Artemisia annua TaxID=35608 RepID=A0A2U1LPJ0_ARTAN|nr:hypothetical protein CTI12_AA301020 [Artemisia annua]
MAFHCFKIQLKKNESATETCGEHSVTVILVHHMSDTTLMWTQSIRIFSDVSSGLSYLHNNKGKTWFSLNENGEDCDALLSRMDTHSTLSYNRKRLNHPMNMKD